MRWHKPYYGDKKIITKFALFPITICRETRWLEKVTIEMEYGITMWHYMRFIDEVK